MGVLRSLLTWALLAVALILLSPVGLALLVLFRRRLAGRFREFPSR